MDITDRHAPLVDWLREKGHANKEIELILSRLRDYETRVQHDSLMDAIGDGSFDIDSLVKEALGEE